MALHCTEAWVTLAARDFEALVNFYRRFLDQEPSIFMGDRYAEFQLPGLRLGIFPPRDRREWEGMGGMSGCLEVENLEAAIAHARAIGAVISPIQRASHGCEVYVTDLEGNRWILHQSN